MQLFRWRTLRKFSPLLLVLTLGLVAFFKPWRAQGFASAEVVILPFPYTFPSSKPPWPDRWIPMNWGWLWRVRYLVLGRPTVIHVDSSVLDVARESEALRTRLAERPPLVNTNSTNHVLAWVLPDEELKSLRSELQREPGNQTVASTRLSTGARTRAQIITATQFKVDGDFYTRTHDKATELTLVVTGRMAVTNDMVPFGNTAPLTVVSIQTNLPLAARMMRSQQKIVLNQMYGALFKDLNLNPEQKQQFMDILLDQMTSGMTNDMVPFGNATPLPVVSIQTNFALAARMMLPNGYGAVLIESGLSSTRRRVLLISVRQGSRKGSR